jgi:hypothetical protein
VKLSLSAGVLSLAESVRIALEKMQPEGCGFNPSLIPVARGLFFSAVGQTRAIKLMTDRAEFLGVAPRRMHEILRAVGKVYHSTVSRSGEKDGNGWAAIKADVPRTEKLCENAITAEQLKRSSPVDPATLKTWPLLRVLFPDRRTLLCVGNDESSAVVIHRDAELHPENLQFIVPNGMIAFTGRNKEGFITTRALSNTGPWRFLVNEFDFSYFDRSGRHRTIWYDTLHRLHAIGRTPQDMCASLLSELSMSEQAVGICRLALVVFSGNKSLQGWFYVAGKTDLELRPFFTLALTLGADRAMWNRHQLCRMPGGLRITGEPGEQRGKRQEIYFFDPNYTTLC